MSYRLFIVLGHCNFYLWPSNGVIKKINVKHYWGPALKWGLNTMISPFLSNHGKLAFNLSLRLKCCQ